MYGVTAFDSPCRISTALTLPSSETGRTSGDFDTRVSTSDDSSGVSSLFRSRASRIRFWLTLAARSVSESVRSRAPAAAVRERGRGRDHHHRHQHRPRFSYRRAPSMAIEAPSLRRQRDAFGSRPFACQHFRRGHIVAYSAGGPMVGRRSGRPRRSYRSTMNRLGERTGDCANSVMRRRRRRDRPARAGHQTSAGAHPALRGGVVRVPAGRTGRGDLPSCRSG